MSRFVITMHLRIALSPSSAAAALTTEQRDCLLTDHLDRVMEELVNLESCMPDVADPAIALDGGTDEVSFELLVTADSAGVAVDRAIATVRAAIHAAGGHTPDWDVAHTEHATEIAEVAEYDVVNVRAEPVAA